MRPLECPIPNTCFMSCLKIIGQDLGFDLDIREFIDRFPCLCHRGTDIEGAFHVTRDNLKIISGVMGFRAELFFDLGIEHLEDEYLGDSRVMFSYHRFRGTDLHAHCQVFVLWHDDTQLLVIDPSMNDYALVPSDMFSDWQCNPVLIRAA